MSLTRRNFLKTLGGVALGALPPNARPDHAGAGATSPQADWCGVGDQGQPLFVPGERGFLGRLVLGEETLTLDRKSTRLNSSHQIISYAVFCLKKKKKPK